MQKFKLREGIGEYPNKFFKNSNIIKYMSEDVDCTEIIVPIDISKDTMENYIHIVFDPNMTDLIRALSIATFLEDQINIANINRKINIELIGLLLDEKYEGEKWKLIHKTFEECVLCFDDKEINKEIVCEIIVAVLNRLPKIKNEKFELIRKKFFEIDDECRTYIFDELKDKVQKSFLYNS